MADRITKLEKAFRRHPDVPLFARLADHYLRRGMAFKALELCQKGCSRFPEYSPGFVVLSRCLEARKDLQEARRVLAHALRLDPENPAGFKHLASICEQLGDAERARKALLKAGRLDPLDEQVVDKLDQLEYAERLEEVTPPEQKPYDELPEDDEIRQALRRVERPNRKPPNEGAAEAEEPAAQPEEPISTVEFAGRAEEPATQAEEPEAPAEAPGAEAQQPPARHEEPASEVQAVAELARWVNMEDEPGAAGRSPAPGCEEAKTEEEVDELELIGLAAGEDQQLVHVLHEIDESPASVPPSFEEPIPQPAAEDFETAPRPPAVQIATATLAEIYCAQGLPERALQIYEKLLEMDPNDAQIEERIAQLQQHRSAGTPPRPQETGSSNG